MTQDNMPDLIYTTGGPTSGSWNKEPINPRIAPPQTPHLKATPAREAAEDMLEALERIANTNGGSPLDRNIRMKAIARAAIAKAKGENT